MGLSDLFNSTEKKEEFAIQQITNLEEYIRAYVDIYDEENKIEPHGSLTYDLLIAYLKGELLRLYMKQVENKDKEAKYFFRELYFKDYVMNAIPRIYNTFEKVDQGYKYQNINDPARRWKYVDKIQQGQAAEESLAKLAEYVKKFEKPNQRTR